MQSVLQVCPMGSQSFLGPHGPQLSLAHRQAAGPAQQQGCTGKSSVPIEVRARGSDIRCCQSIELLN